MIVIHVEIKVQAAQLENFLAVNEAFIQVAAAMNGCEKFRLYRDSWEESTFIYYQEWASEEDFRAYQASPAFAEHGGNLRTMLAGPPDAAYYDGAKID